MTGGVRIPLGAGGEQLFGHSIEYTCAEVALLQENEIDIQYRLAALIARKLAEVRQQEPTAITFFLKGENRSCKV